MSLFSKNIVDNPPGTMFASKEPPLRSMISDTDFLPLERGKADDRAYDRIRGAIITGQFLPNQRLVEAEVAMQLKIGRSSVRTAMARLAQERLIERIPNRGAHVRRLSKKEAVELREARSALECLAVRYAALNATDDDSRRVRATLRKMEASIRENDGVAFTESNWEFHSSLLRISCHTVAAEMIDVLRTRRSTFQTGAVLTPDDPMFRYRQHCDIAAAVEAHDPDRAEQMMRLHLSDVKGSRRLREEEG